jgi:amino acid transporter
MAVMNNVSVWWHVAGASAIVLILILVPDQHQSFSYVFTERFNNSGYADGSTSSVAFWFAIVPFGFLLTQYTITGFDACAHLSEETSSASTAAAKGIWRSIFYSALGGYVLLLCVVFAIPDDAAGNPDNALAGGGVAPIFLAALDKNWATVVLFISASAQFFCATSCLTSSSRMTFAFARDNGIPGSRLWAQLTPRRVPANAVIGVAVAAAVLTLPALIKVDVGGTPVPLAFYAVTSIAVIGLYLAFAIPIYLRWRLGDAFEVGAWNNGSKYKWMNLIAVAEILIVSLFLMMPTTPAANPFRDEFEIKFLNYAPVVTIGALLLLTIWWKVSAHKWFTGPIQNIDPTVAEVYEGGH